MNIDPLKSIRSQIVEHFRLEIRCGNLKPGDRLPPARELAHLFGTAEANVHHALAALVKEGMVTRRPKAGTVVADGVEKLYCAAIYLNWHSIQRGENFTRLLIAMLERRFAANNIKCVVIYDTPSQDGLERLKKLAETREIQGVVVRSLLPDQYAFFSRLPVPFSAVSSMRIPNRVSFFSPETLRKIMERICSDNVKKLGIISSANLEDSSMKLSQEHGLEVRREWVANRGIIPDSSIFAYAEFERIWNLPERPEALLVFSDDMVSGLAMSFYHRQVKVPEDIRLYIHKTRENELVLPFPCVLLENRIQELADALVCQLIDQSEGRPPIPQSLGCEFRDWMPQ